MSGSLGLTPVQAKALAFIRTYNEGHPHSPSFDEIKDALGLASKSGVHRIVHALAQRGHITRQRNRARTIAVGPNYRALLQTLAELVATQQFASAGIFANEIVAHFRGQQ
jgi:repressor LexA